MPRLLVTTADQRSWQADKSLLFIGGWCKLPDQRDKWEGLDAETLPYHWDNHEKFCADYAYLQASYERLLARVASLLNEHHQTCHALRYWRILLGPWLCIFTHVLFDRWEMVRLASQRPDIEKTILIADPEDELIPRDLAGMSPDDLRWNNFLYACAIREQGLITIEEQPGQRKGLMQNTSTVDNVVGFKDFLKDAAGFFLGLLTRRSEVFFIKTHLARKIEVRLQLRLRQMPKFWRSSAPPQVQPDLELRRSLQLPADDEGVDSFQVFLARMAVRQIPTVYLEGYSALMRQVAELRWPSNPRCIFTSNAFQFDEVFQAWAAEKTESGSKLVIGQHGGAFGVGRNVSGEDHQVEIADRFLTWGWRDDRKSIWPCLALTNLGRPLGPCRSDGSLLLVTVPIRMMSFRCNSWAVGANQSQAFLADQLSFARELAAPVRDRLVLRIHKRTDDKVRSAFIPQWRAAFPGVEVDPSVTPIGSRILQCRLFASTYNSTGFLEALAHNIPTVIFWNPEHWALRDSAIPYFQLLADAGIFFEKPDLAALHINSIWDDVDAWWTSAVVQNARRTFCEVYVRSVPDPESQLLAALTFEGKSAFGK
jgi:putative transferase (TIGR04331 family)